MKENFKILLFILFIVVMIPNIVEATVVQDKVCCKKGDANEGLYSVSYDTAKNTEVSKSKINCDNINDQHLQYPNNVEDEKYKFNATKIAGACIEKNGVITACPQDSNLLTKIEEKYADKIENGQPVKNENVQMTFDGSGKFNAKIKNVFGNKYKVRYSFMEEGKNEGENGAAYYSDFLTPINGYYYIYGVSATQTIGLEFYQNGGKDGCDGAFIGGIPIFTPDLTEVEIDNPALTDSSYGCIDFYKWKPNLDPKDYNSSDLNDLKKVVANFCYEPKIKYLDYVDQENPYRDRVQEGIDSLKNLFGDITITAADKSSSKSCGDVYNGRTQVHAWAGPFWAYRCVENYKAYGEAPKLVHAGGGFSYEATFEVTRSCDKIKMNPKKHYQPVEVYSLCPVYKYKQKCERKCSWYNPKTGASGDGDSAGPSEDFDQCIQLCDGGKYTQNCINSCYSENYNKERDLKFSSTFSLNERKPETQFTFTIPLQAEYPGLTWKAVPGVKTDYNLDAVEYTPQIKGVTCPSAKVSFWCSNGGHGTCWWDIKTEVAGIDTYYCKNVQMRAQEEEALVEEVKLAEINIDESKFSMTITDSYLKDSKKKPLETTYTNNTGLNVKVIERTNEHALVKISLPLSYINKQTAEAMYKTGSTYTTWQIKDGKLNFDKVKTGTIPFTKLEADYYFDKDKSGKPNERKYYTNLHSKNTNVVADKDFNIYLDGSHPDGLNIKAVGAGMGWSNYGSTVKCFYGVYNEFYGDDNPCNPINGKEACDGGLQYIFRPIDLSDLFPNGREPRYNWSSAATSTSSKNPKKGYELYGTDVNPVGYTNNLEQEDQNKKDALHEDPAEIDYRFTLTPKSIATIKNYNANVSDFNNDGYNNYLDYDVSCTKTRCINNFLSNTQNLEYGSGFTVANREEIAKCNNAISGQYCDMKAHN